MRHLRLVTQDPVWQAEGDYRPRHLKVVPVREFRVYSREEATQNPQAVGNGPAVRGAFLSQLFLRSRNDVPAGYRMGQADRVTPENNVIEDRMDNDPHAR